MYVFMDSEYPWKFTSKSTLDGKHYLVQWSAQIIHEKREIKFLFEFNQSAVY